MDQQKKRNIFRMYQGKNLSETTIQKHNITLNDIDPLNPNIKPIVLSRIRLNSRTNQQTKPENRLHPDCKHGEPVKILRETSLVNDTIVKKPNESNGKKWDGYAMEYKPKEKDPFISDDEE
jgi:hypothetical protein